VVVTAFIPELEMVVARNENEDLEVHLVDKVPGVHWNELPRASICASGVGAETGLTTLTLLCRCPTDHPQLC
jgi:hypothetical protein